MQDDLDIRHIRNMTWIQQSLQDIHRSSNDESNVSKTHRER